MKPSYEELEEQLNRSRRLCDAALANERVWETTMMEACGEDGPASVAAEIKALRAQRDTAMESLRQQLSALAAENAWLKAAHPQPFGTEMMKALDAYEKHQDEVPETGMLDAFFILRDSIRVETPATDAFLAEMRSKARNEGINYAAGRLAAAFNHGFVDKPLAEVCDVVHMILDTKEELAGSMIPAVDGLSGEYAEAFLKDSAAQLRKGVQS
ncbi:hypothetical protein [Enterobacter cloacae complex sp. IR5457]|uniref:hypothetical protein n=1 Tax=Enterobacter cloacae complex sp. IR5457 TaxID=3412374 RepID=UPI003BA0678C